MLTSLVPVPVNINLNQIKIGLVNGSFSNGNGQHSHCIAERKWGRQWKIHESGKIFVKEIWV